MSPIDIAPIEVEEKIRATIARLGPEPEDIVREARFEALDIDSLDLVEITQVVEEEWGIVIEPQDLGGVETVGDAIDLVLRRLG